ncbi:hypothetical protein ACLOJK_021208 [Asimina triloba]
MKIPFSSTNSMTIRSLIKSHIIPTFSHAGRAISRAKSTLIRLLDKAMKRYMKDQKRRRKKKNSLYGSFRLHYNWSSSHIIPLPDPVPYYDFTWDSTIFPAEAGAGAGAGDGEEGLDPPLASYLRWLEEKLPENSAAEVVVDEIDRLADMFIANCYEKFRLEKQESDRRFQEMLARGM